MKVTIEREVLHQLARGVLGTRRELQPPTTIEKVAEAARRIAAATASRDSGPLEIEVVG